MGLWELPTPTKYSVQVAGQDKVEVADTSSEMEIFFRLCCIHNDTTAPMDNSISEQNIPVQVMR